MIENFREVRIVKMAQWQREMSEEYWKFHSKEIGCPPPQIEGGTGLEQGLISCMLQGIPYEQGDGR